MSTEVEICNRALSRIGIDQYIEALDDPKSDAVNCNLHYHPCRREVLQDYDWPFARKMQTLALVSDTVPGWAYAYRYPTDCLTVLKVALQETDDSVPYIIMGDEDDNSRLIVTDLQLACCVYTYDVKDVNQMPEAFRSALSWRLAAELALAMRADAQRASFAQDQYLAAVSRAGAHAFNESPGPARAKPATVAIR